MKTIDQRIEEYLQQEAEKNNHALNEIMSHRPLTMGEGYISQLMQERLNINYINQ